MTYVTFLCTCTLYCIHSLLFMMKTGSGCANPSHFFYLSIPWMTGSCFYICVLSLSLSFFVWVRFCICISLYSWLCICKSSFCLHFCFDSTLTRVWWLKRNIMKFLLKAPLFKLSTMYNLIMWMWILVRPQDGWNFAREFYERWIWF